MTMRNINEYLLSKKHTKTAGIEVGDVVHIKYVKDNQHHIVVGKNDNDTLYVLNLFKDAEEYSTHDWESDLTIINACDESDVDKVIYHNEFSQKELDMFINFLKHPHF